MIDSSFTSCMLWEGHQIHLSSAKGAEFLHSAQVNDAQAKAEFHGFGLELI